MRTAVVGHLEWIEFGHVERVPAAGDIAHATDPWEEPGGGRRGRGRAARAARGRLHLLHGARATTNAAPGRGASSRGSACASRPPPATSRRVVGVVFVDANGERTITPSVDASNPRPPTTSRGTSSRTWTPSTSPRATRAPCVTRARARTLVATSRDRRPARRGRRAPGRGRGQRRGPGRGVRPRVAHRSTRPGRSDRRRGRAAEYETDDGRSGTYEAVAPPGPVVDTYGAGDSFAAGLTFALGRGLELEEAMSLAARCGAWCVAGRGPYGNQLAASDLER